MKEKAVVIYHSKDLDGFCSGAIAIMALRSKGYEVIPIGYNYGEPIPNILIHQPSLVVMVDVTFTVDVMLNLFDGEQFEGVVIDHHKSFFDLVASLHYGIKFQYIYSNVNAACELVWNYFYPDKPIPEIVDAIAVWDIHRMDTHLYKTFDTFDEYAQCQKVMKLRLKSPSVGGLSFIHWEDLLTDRRKSLSFINDCLADAEVLDEHTKHTASILNGKNMVLFGYPLTAYNFPLHVSSGVSKCVDAPRENALAFYHFAGDRVIFSLRQNEAKGSNHQILGLAKRAGGGGHENACGFSMSEDEFTRLVLHIPF